MILPVFISYLSGAIPFGLLISRAKRVDIRKVGSGNIGATNVSRALGIKYAALVATLDILKGYLPVILVFKLYSNPQTTAAAAGAAFLGHIFPVFLKFKGGKGVATFTGTMLAILNIKLVLVILIIWVILLYVTKTMSLTNLILSVIIPVLFFIDKGVSTYLLFSIFASVIVWWTHRENINRILNGTEKKLNIPKLF